MNCANHPDREKVAFCQDCGKPLCQECTRTIGPAVYCEQSLAARLSGAGAQQYTGEPRGSYTSTPTGGSYTYTGNAGGIDYTVSGNVPPSPPPGAPNPGLAALLGFIPGVGAMYNGQYAKGIVHLIIFAILVSLSDEHGIFGLLTAGWVIYQIIEAHHTARARRDGTPLPNPFGLNDIGERLGFGKSWPNTSPSAGASVPFNAAAPPNSANATSSASASTASTGSYPPPGYPQQEPYTGWNSAWENVPPAHPQTPPYAAPAYGYDSNLPDVRNRFPAGAIWLIGLGVFFLIGNSGLFRHFPFERLLPFLLIGLGVWLFVRRMTSSGISLSDDGTPGYQYRLFHAINSSIWVVLVGVLFLLDSFRILSWSHSWPLFIIVAGLMAFFRRTMYTPPPPPMYPYTAPPATPPPAPPITSIVPSSSRDQEGK